MHAAAILATALLATAPAPRLESIRVEKTAEAAEIRVRLSVPLVKPPEVRAAGRYVAFALPGVTADAPRKVLDARDDLFEQAILLSRPDELLVAVRSRVPGLLARARAEGSGRELRLKLYRSDEALRSAEAALELERALAGASPDSRQAPPVSPPAPAGAQRAPGRPPAPPPAATRGELGGSVRALAALAALAVAVAVGLWYVRRGRGHGRTRHSPISVLAVHPVGGGKRHLLLVEVQGQHLLLGSAEGGIRLLSRIEPPPVDEGPPPPPAPGPVARWLRRLRQARAPAAVAAEKVALPSEATAVEADASSPGWTAALGEALATESRSAPDVAASTADLIRRKLAELNRA